jgi:hypothetical protein
VVGGGIINRYLPNRISEIRNEINRADLFISFF